MSIDNDDFGEDVNDQANDFGEQANEIGEEVIMNEQANEIGGEVDEKLNVSSESARTVPGKELECIPDLVFHHARTSALIEDTLYSRRRAGIKLHHFCPVVISEFKAGPHRGLSEELLKLEISLHFAEAYKQLARYLVWTFAKHPYLDEIVAIPVAGLYWYYVRVLRSDMPELTRGARTLKNPSWGGFQDLDMDIGTLSAAPSVVARQIPTVKIVDAVLSIHTGYLAT
ncbi:hypothetical protein DL96DRAFT_1710356 [Flagelloscypha sp. PMI_526]|nr:hypothetical protein DL96DRAFT_1710356 [Flagelloscypha sp. PMI_526]